MTQSTETVDYRALMQDALAEIERLQEENQRLSAACCEAPSSSRAPRHPLLGRRVRCAVPAFESDLSREELAWLADHRVYDLALAPAAAWLEMAIAAAVTQEAAGAAADVCELSDIVFEKMLVRRSDQPQIVQTLLLTSPDGRRTFEIQSLDESSTDGSSTGGAAESRWTRRAHGEIQAGGSAASSRTPPLSDLRFRLRERIASADFYYQLSQLGLQYGPAFRGVEEISRRSGEALARLRRPHAAPSSDAWLVHPAMLDAALQALAAAMPRVEPQQGESATAFVPVACKSLRFLGPLPDAVWSYATIQELSDQRLTAEVRLLDDAGRVLLEITGLQCHATHWRQDPETPAISDCQGAETGLTREELLAADEEKQHGLLSSYMIVCAAEVLGMDPARLDADDSLDRWGIDSVMTVDLFTRLQRELQVRVMLDALNQDLSIDELAHLFLSRLRGESS